jgi:hypothetical protein
VSAEYLEAGEHFVTHHFGSDDSHVVHEWKLTNLCTGTICLHCDHCRSVVRKTGERSWTVSHQRSCPWLRRDPPFDQEAS